jgi:hypothetical protein
MLREHDGLGIGIITGGALWAPSEGSVGYGGGDGCGGGDLNSDGHGRQFELVCDGQGDETCEGGDRQVTT